MSYNFRFGPGQPGQTIYFTFGANGAVLPPSCQVCANPALVTVPRELLEKMRRLAHPDTHAQAGPRTLELASEVTKALNAALDPP